MIGEMRRIRAIEEDLARHYPEGKMHCPVHLSIGQEGVVVGVISALSPGDHIYCTHRSHAHYLAKGGNLDAMLAELEGRPDGCCEGRGGSMHLVDESVGMMGSYPIVGDSVSIATGAALAAKLEGKGRRIVAFMGDGGLESGQFWESLNFAVLHRLPLLYVCENNGYAVQTPLIQRQPAIPSILERVRPWLPAESVTDRVVHVNSSARSLLGRLPAFLEAQTYRYREHVGPGYDWDLGYRTRQEVEAHMSADELR